MLGVSSVTAAIVAEPFPYGDERLFVYCSAFYKKRILKQDISSF
jgi:hypothetical protein